MRIMIAGGGTGGHTSPAQAFIEELRKRDPQLLVQWVGKRGAIEERVARNAAVTFRPLRVAGWPRKKSPRMLWVGLKMAWAALRSALYIKKFDPQLVIGVGGYVSLPLLLVAQRMGLPTIIHEQNRRMGLANRMLAPRATRVFVSYEDTEVPVATEDVRVVGNPVRSGFIAPPDRGEAREQFELAPDVPVILVVGGSQGAQTINRALAEILPELQPEEAQVIWMAGKTGFEEARKAAEQSDSSVRIFAFIDDMPAACAAADVAVARAGASTTAELAAIGLPAILVPYPHATDDHQTENARAFEEAGAGVLLPDQECNGAALLEVLRPLLNNLSERERMAEAARSLAKPLAAETVAEEAMLLIFGQEKNA